MKTNLFRVWANVCLLALPLTSAAAASQSGPAAKPDNTCVNSLIALDLNERTVKAPSLFNTKKVNPADHCAIVINGKMEFTCDEINDVNGVNRIAPVVEPPVNSVMTRPSVMGY